MLRKILENIVGGMMVLSIAYFNPSLVCASSKKEIKNLLSSTEDQELLDTTNASILVGPYYKDSSVSFFHLEGTKGELFFRALNEERRLHDLPEEDFLGIEERLDRSLYISPKIDLEKNPQFFEKVNARYLASLAEKKKELLTERAEESSIRKDRNIQNINFMLRWGTSVFFFSTLASYGNMSMLSIAAISFVATFIANNRMRQYEEFLSNNGKRILKAPVSALKATAFVGNKIPYLSHISKNFFQWAEERYRNKIEQSEHWQSSSQLAVAFLVNSAFVGAYAIAMNLSEIGLSESVRAGGNSFVQFGDHFWNLGQWRFLEGFQAETFLSALQTDIAQFQFDKLIDLLAQDPIVIKALIFTLYGESWTLYRRKLRALVDDPSTANRFGWIMGAFFALMAPIIHKSSNVILGKSFDFISVTGVVLATGISIWGLLYVYGDGPRYSQRMADLFTRAKKRAQEKTRNWYGSGYLHIASINQSPEQTTGSRNPRSHYKQTWAEKPPREHAALFCKSIL